MKSKSKSKRKNNHTIPRVIDSLHEAQVVTTNKVDDEAVKPISGASFNKKKLFLAWLVLTVFLTLGVIIAGIYFPST